MAVTTGPKIVTDGLVLSLNATSARCHPGGGAGVVWSDPVGSNDVTLENGVVLSSDFRTANEVTGGTVTIHGEYIIHTFTNDSASENFITNTHLHADVLILAGGGGGGMDMGGGGGAGGLIYNESVSIASGTHAVVVGSGGTGAPAANTGGQPGGHQYSIGATAGENTTAFSYTASGGGLGGSSYYGYTPESSGGAGGSGGGVSGYGDTNARSGGSGVANQGNDGGSNTTGGRYYSGGGGGAGEAGVWTGNTNPPHGGNGRQINIDGNNYYWAGGGGGSAYSSTPGGNGGDGGGGGGAVGTTTGGSGINAGGAGGGGAPGSYANTPGGDGGANTGGGGGGGAHYNANNKGGEGGSGIVIVRYHKKYAPRNFYYDFDGADDYVTRPNFQIGNGLRRTFSCWAKFDSLTANNLINMTANANNYKWQYFQVNNGIIYFMFGDNSFYNERGYSTAVVATTGVWYNFVVTVDTANGSGNSCKLYVNGESTAVTYDNNSLATIYDASDMHLYIGNSNWTGSISTAIDGDISIASIYDRALSAAEVLQNFEAHKGRFGL